MRRFPLRRVLGAFLALVLVVGAPGSEAYYAAAQTIGGRASEPGSASRAIPILGLSGPSSEVSSLSAAAFSLSPAVLSAPVAAPEVRAVPAAALAVPARAAAAGVAAVPTRSAHVSALPAAAVAETSSAVGTLFDGSAAKHAVETPVVASVRRGAFGRSITKGLAILALSLGVLGVSQDAHAQLLPLMPPPIVSPSDPADKLLQTKVRTVQDVIDLINRSIAGALKKAATPAAQAPAPVVLPRPIEAGVVVDRQGVTVGERIHLTITLRNTSDKPVTLEGLRSSLQEALPEDLELEGKDAEAPLALAPGESQTIVYEAIPFGSGTLTLDGGIAVVAVGETAAYPQGIEIVLPATEITVASVLTPDWKEKGLRDIVGVKRADGPDWMWLAAIPLGILLLVGVHRLVAARRLYPKLNTQRLSLVTVAEAELARLKAASDDRDAASFYARYQDLLTGFMVDFAGLPKAARDARALERDLRKSSYDAGQISVAARLAAAAEAARFAGLEKDASERGRMLDRLAALIESVAGKAGQPQADNTGVFALLALLPGAAGLAFGSPWVLLLLAPFAAYALWSWRNRAKGGRFTVSSSAQTPARRTVRERLAGLPRVLRLAALGLIILALARPMIGTQRSETFIPSTDTVVSIDLSSSMSGDKLQGVRDAVRGYIEEQRRGTENRVGMVTFSDDPYLDVKLTTDYDALISHLKELGTSGNTAVGKAMLTSIAHFLELNALDLDAQADPRAAEVQRLLRDQGLSAALAYAKPYPDLMQKILQPDRAKIVVLFTDGDSNSGIDPQAAASIAASLGVKIYGVGIAGPHESFNEATLRGVAEKTGAKFFRAGDADAMRAVLLEISRLEKSPAKIVSSVTVKDYTSLLALLAFLLLGAELTLANTRLRTLYGMAFVMALGAGPLDAPRAVPAPPAAVAASAEAPKSATEAVPPEVIEGNKLYHQGLFAQALKKYGEAIERHPDVPEIYFNMADVYLRLGENVKADAAWAKYLALTPDLKKQSQTLFNLANSALEAGDAEKAVELYKEALRRDSGNQDAKWNLEALKQAQKEQQQQQQDSKKGKAGKQKGKPGKQKGKSSEGQPEQGQPGNGQPGDGKPAQAKPDPQAGADRLGQELGAQDKEAKDAAREYMTRRGSGVWGVAAVPLAFAGQGIVFSSSAFLWAVVLGLPVAALLVAWGIKKRLDAARRLSPGTAPKSFRSWWGARRFLGKSALALAALGLIGLTAGDPRGGMVDERVNFGGKDIVVTVDGSYSMVYAEDGRMARTQKELSEFIMRLQGTDRVGLVVFAGQARTASPISIDYSNSEFKINRLDVEARDLAEGSNLAAAIEYSAAHFETAKKLGDRQRILIVISDGDVPEADIDDAITAAAEHGVTVYAIGVGDPAGTKIKIPTSDGTGTMYLIDDKTGESAVTRLNEAPLRKLSERTGGAYFRAGGRASIDRILNEVSRLEKGQRGDQIKSPRPIGVYLLWPALLMLLLDLLLPGRSLLRRGVPAQKLAAAEKPKSGGSGALLGAALIPLGAWPQILPFAAFAVVVAAYLAADSWSGGAITRRIREAWQSRRGVVEKGVAADLVHLYDLREADERRLSAFVKRWQNASEPRHEALIAAAARDGALWRESLTAAYLSGAAPETLEKILAALRRTARQRLEPLAPVTGRMLARRELIAWMAHAEAEARLAALAAVAAGQPAVLAVPAPASAPAGFFARFKRGAVVGMLVLMIALTGVSSVGTAHFRAEQRAAAEFTLKNFYAEDLFVFSDRYVDARIPEQVLPALKRWHESRKTAGADFARALAILRESPDPKADNILVAIFRHVGVLPLTNAGKDVLLRALIERESDSLWNSMDDLIQSSRGDPAAARMLVRLVTLGVESNNEKTILRLFRVLKSPNESVAQLSGRVLFAYLSRDGGSRFFEILKTVQATYELDPDLQLWTASFAFFRLTDPAAAVADLRQAKDLLDRALINAARLDAVRRAIYAQTPPDEDIEAPPSLTTELVDLADHVLGDGGASASSAEAARFLVTEATNLFIREAEAAIPGLHERLIQDGVTLPDGQGFIFTTATPRERYRLDHLRAFWAALEDMGGPLVAEPTQENAALRELLDRAGATIAKSLEAGAKAGMKESGGVPDAAADQLLPVLREGYRVFSRDFFLRVLRAESLAPAFGDPAGPFAYPEALDAASLAKLREALLGIARSGNGWDDDGNPRTLTWGEKIYLVGALEAVDAARWTYYPDAAMPGASDAESLALARLALALAAHPKDADFALKAEESLIKLLARGPLNTEDALKVLEQIFTVVNGTENAAAATAAIVDAMRLPNSAVLAPAVAAMILNPALHNGWNVFPGDVFVERLRDKGFLNKNLDGDYEFKQSYTRQEVAAIRAWLKGVLAAGRGRESGASRPLQDKEKAALRRAIAAAEQALKCFPAPADPGLHAFAPLTMAALPGLAPWLLFTILGLSAAYLVWRLLARRTSGAAVESPARAEVPADVIARHRRIELSARRLASAVGGGLFRSRFIGPGGIDFAEARPYQGEDLREMDWKTSAKKGEPFAKKFELERDMPLMLVIDISRSGRFGTRGTDKRTVIEDAAAVLALAAAHSNIRVGAVLVSDRVEKVIPARGGARHAMAIVDAILQAEPTGVATNLKPGLEAAGRLLGSRAMVAVLSDFLAPDFKDALGALASRHDVRAIRVSDPAELGPLPDVGLLPVVDAETGVTRLLDTSSRAGRAEAAAAVARREAAIENAFDAARLHPILISTAGDPLDSLERGFHPKAKPSFTP